MKNPALGAALGRWKALFFPKRFLIDEIEATPLDGAGVFGELLLVRRSLCQFTWLDAAGVPPAARSGLVNEHLRRVAPFEAFQSSQVWFGDAVAIWYWPSELAVRPRLARGPRRVVAETALRLGQAPGSDGLECLRVSSGFEALLWKGGRPVASRHWAAPPSREDVAAFQRRGGFPEPIEGHWASEPQAIPPVPIWRAAVQRGSSASTRDVERTVALVAGGLISLALAFVLGQWASIRLAESQVAEEMSALETEIGETLDAQGLFETNAARLETLGTFARGLSQAQAFDVVSASIGTEGRIIDWRQRPIDRLAVQFSSPSPDLERIVIQLEESGLFDEVEVSLAQVGGQFELRAAVNLDAFGRPASAAPTAAGAAPAEAPP